MARGNSMRELMWALLSGSLVGGSLRHKRGETMVVRPGRLKNIPTCDPSYANVCGHKEVYIPCLAEIRCDRIIGLGRNDRELYPRCYVNRCWHAVLRSLRTVRDTISCARSNIPLDEECKRWNPSTPDLPVHPNLTSSWRLWGGCSLG